MIKKITVIILSCIIIFSCGKKSDPKYIDPEKKAELKKVLITPTPARRRRRAIFDVFGVF